MEGAKKMAALMRVESQFDMGASSMHKGILVLFFWSFFLSTPASTRCWFEYGPISSHN